MGVSFLAVVAISGAVAMTSAYGSEDDFSVSQCVSSQTPLRDFIIANDLMAGSAAAGSATTGNCSVVNFKDADEPGKMHFPGSTPFPSGDTPGTHNFVMHINGEVEIPEAGTWTFGVKSNGGFHLQIGTNSIERNAYRGASNKIAPIIFEQAGTYSCDLTYFEHARAASLELFASEGKYHQFGADGAQWRLVGDAADGGLCLTSTSSNTDSSSGNNSSSENQSAQNPTVSSADSAIPEPGGALLAVVVTPWLLGRRWRSQLH
jgi:hypothetical protein